MEYKAGLHVRRCPSTYRVAELNKTGHNEQSAICSDHFGRPRLQGIGLGQVNMFLQVYFGPLINVEFPSVETFTEDISHTASSTACFYLTLQWPLHCFKLLRSYSAHHLPSVRLQLRVLQTTSALMRQTVSHCNSVVPLTIMAVICN